MLLRSRQDRLQAVAAHYPVLWRALLLGLAAAPCLTVSGQDADQPSRDNAYDFRQITLDNGLQVITLEDHSCPIVSVQIWYHVGSKDEDPQRQGFAHMFEHMMFRGTDRLGANRPFRSDPPDGWFDQRLHQLRLHHLPRDPAVQPAGVGPVARGRADGVVANRSGVV